MRDNYFPDMEVKSFRAIRGKPLEPGEKSRGLYGIIGVKKDLLLRVAIDPRIAEIYTECDSRSIQEIFLEELK